jgi:alkanesulfonate monooxygenase SsuD/methylene tetrahydromethanopterin reductase-like flavin-dependent oxidoreductase (luciferase family)
MENHGIDVKRRRALVREKMLAMQALWSSEVAEFHGEFVDFAPSWQWPKPVQQPRPRVLIGGAPGPKLFEHIAEYGDGWLPIGGAGVKEALEKLRAAYERRGRDAQDIHVVPMGIQPSAEKLAYYQELGVTEAVLRLPSAPRDQVMPVLDDFASYLG